jgi:hypothetical protein
VLSPAQAIANIATTVDGLGLNGGNANSLKAKLNTALNQIQNGNMTPAGNQLHALLNEIDAMVNSGKITAADGATLGAAVNRLLATL